MSRGSWAAVGSLVLMIFAFAARSGVLESVGSGASETYYNLLVRGWQAGRLELARAVPPGLAALPDPYDPAASAVYRAPPYGLHDLSYYKGRLYFYFGVTPALLLFWPYAALTGHYLFHSQAAAIFCALGFLASAGLLRSLRRRYFADVGPGVTAACLLALGLASGWTILLSRSEVYEVAIACGAMLVLVGLGAGWLSWHAAEGRRMVWLAAASLGAGLAVGARPSLLPGVCVLAGTAGFFVQRKSGGMVRPSPWLMVLAGLLPFAGCGLGLAYYNYVRFGQVFEFGQRYQLAGMVWHPLLQRFNLGFENFNLRVYFLAPVRWGRHFPFISGITPPPLPAGHYPVEDPFGVLVDVPLVWLALAAPLAWRGRPQAERGPLVWLAGTLVWLAGTAVLVVGLLDGSCSRYEVDFLPALIVLAVLGILGLERTLAGRTALRRCARITWGLLLGWSIAFNLLAAVEHYAEARCDTGLVLMHAGRLPEAISAYEAALRVKPAYPDARIDLGVTLARLGRWPEAIAQYQAALALTPENLPARINLGNALAQSGRLSEAIVEYERAIALDPREPDVQYNLGHVLELSGRSAEAQAHFAEAARLESARR